MPVRVGRKVCQAHVTGAGYVEVQKQEVSARLFELVDDSTRRHQRLSISQNRLNAALPHGKEFKKCRYAFIGTAKEDLPTDLSGVVICIEVPATSLSRSVTHDIERAADDTTANVKRVHRIVEEIFTFRKARRKKKNGSQSCSHEPATETRDVAINVGACPQAIFKKE